MQENFGHYSVMLKETVDGLNVRKGGIYVDCTLGGAGHSEEILKRLCGNGLVVGIDQDDFALSKARERLLKYKDNIKLIKGNFSQTAQLLKDEGIDRIDGVVADLGVSSFQLDDAQRGFSYMKDAPLDMRMNRDSSFSAYNVVNEYTEGELARIIDLYGEERFAKRIASNICCERKTKPIETTLELVQIVKKSVPIRSRQESSHPAKRTFQAIRIEVNGELDVIDKMINGVFPMLNSTARMSVISFHSLEDRIVKHTFLELTKGCECPPDFPVCICGKKAQGVLITKKPILPSEKELEENSRSKSAKLRICEKI